jgi:predicted short-subunit dehydrogenase-like oxidoreductase (DUF2520 family)
MGIPEESSVAILGAGRLGGAAGRLLALAGWRIAAVTGRTPASAEAAARFVGGGAATTDLVQAASAGAIVLITTPDRAIREVCAAVARGGGFRPGAIVAHASGAHTLDLLDAAREAGALRAVVHPLQSVPSREAGVANLPGAFFRVEADPGALETAREIVRALGGRELALPRWTPDAHSAALYHAGAVAVSNYLVALLDFGLAFFRELGAERDEALRAVLPLVRGTLENVERLGIPEALTGPIARGDGETVAVHLAAMRERAPALLALYRELALRTIALAEERGSVGAPAAEELRRVVRE